MKTPLTLLLTRLAAELDGVTELASRIETTMDHDANAKGRDSRTLQNMDLLTQTLADLSRFGTAMAKVVPDTLVDPAAALDAIRLGAVASRLSGHELSVEPTHGDVSVF
ncbi:MAG: hypothetical protein KKB02_11425 [Alphaproteobacteria bacterium]|nr:hypothetical protein [Alphaproteobacteria bacterium]